MIQSMTSPIHYDDIILIDDMSDKMQNHVIIYADDSSVFSTIKDRKIRAHVACKLNEDLLHIQNTGR